MIHGMIRRRNRWVPPSPERVPMNVHPDARARLRRLLFEPEMQACGYSEFIMRAVDETYQQIVERRAEQGRKLAEVLR